MSMDSETRDKVREALRVMSGRVRPENADRMLLGYSGYGGYSITADEIREKCEDIIFDLLERFDGQ